MFFGVSTIALFDARRRCSTDAFSRPSAQQVLAGRLAPITQRLTSTSEGGHWRGSRKSWCAILCRPRTLMPLAVCWRTGASRLVSRNRHSTSVAAAGWRDQMKEPTSRNPRDVRSVRGPLILSEHSLTPVPRLHRSPTSSPAQREYRMGAVVTVPDHAHERDGRTPQCADSCKRWISARLPEGGYRADVALPSALGRWASRAPSSVNDYWRGASSRWWKARRVIPQSIATTSPFR